MKKGLNVLLAVTMVAAVAFAATEAVKVHQSTPASGHQTALERCLWVSTREYPDLLKKVPHGKQPQLDQVPECKYLSRDDQSQVRNMVREFVIAWQGSN